jgi:hypothetical protein
MAFEKVEYKFPDEEENKKIEVESSSAVEIDISGKATKDEYAKTKDKVEDTADNNASEVDIEVVDDTPKADRGRKASEPPAEVTESELEEYSDKVKNRIKHFSKGYHDERREKEKAIREAQELEKLTKQLVEENKQLKSTTVKNQTAMLDQAKKSAEKELESAKAAYKVAYEAGEADAVVEAQESITAAKIKSDRLNNFKLPTLQEDETPVETKGETTTTPAPVVDKRANEWAKANTWFGTDDEMTSYVLGLHSKLVKTNGQEYTQTNEYYETIDSRMRKVFPENFEDTETEVETETEKPKLNNVVAPATRSTAPKKVRLTQTQVTLANRLGVPLELYAKKVAEEMRKK